MVITNVTMMTMGDAFFSRLSSRDRFVTGHYNSTLPGPAKKSHATNRQTGRALCFFLRYPTAPTKVLTLLTANPLDTFFCFFSTTLPAPSKTLTLRTNHEPGGKRTTCHTVLVYREPVVAIIT